MRIRKDRVFLIYIRCFSCFFYHHASLSVYEHSGRLPSLGFRVLGQWLLTCAFLRLRFVGDDMDVTLNLQSAQG